MRKLAVLMAVLIVAMAAVPANAGSVGQLGVLDTSGINPATGVKWAVGDQYRLVFVTSEGTRGIETEISYYNSFVQSAADAAGLGLATWNIIGSTADVDARDNTGANPTVEAGVPVFLIDGTTLVADDNADLWGSPLYASINLDENGAAASGIVWTGTLPDGTMSIGKYLGISGQVQVGAMSDLISTRWISNGSRGAHLTYNVFPVYAMSEVLAVKDVNAARNPSPADGQYEILIANPLTLQWSNPDPNGSPIYADVFFGNDPCSLAPVTTVPADGLDVTSAQVDASVEGAYYWRVDITVGDTNVVEGDVWSFTTIDDLTPIVTIETPDMLTWSDEPVQIEATVDDQGEGDVAYVWTAVPDGGEGLIVDFDDNAEDPLLTVINTTGSMVAIEMTLTASDATFVVSKSISVEVYTDACDMTKNGVGTPPRATDINKDCVTDMLDLAQLAARWLILDAETTAVPK